MRHGFIGVLVSASLKSIEQLGCNSDGKKGQQNKMRKIPKISVNALESQHWPVLSTSEVCERQIGVFLVVLMVCFCCCRFRDKFKSYLIELRV